MFVLSLFVPHLSFCWCFGRAVLRSCGIFLVPLLIFFLHTEPPSVKGSPLKGNNLLTLGVQISQIIVSVKYLSLLYYRLYL